jgi:hypothetical protein
MTYGILLWMLIKIGLNAVAWQGVVLGQPVGGDLRLLGSAVEFGAIAGRENGRLAHLLGAQQIMQRSTESRRVERQLLADGERGGMVVDPEGEELHQIGFSEFSKL